jgi:hypothetical protein
MREIKLRLSLPNRFVVKKIQEEKIKKLNKKNINRMILEESINILQFHGSVWGCGAVLWNLFFLLYVSFLV